MIDSISRPAGYVHSLGERPVGDSAASRPSGHDSPCRRWHVRPACPEQPRDVRSITLQTLGYVGSDEPRSSHLTPRVLTLGYAYLSSLSFADVAQSHLSRPRERGARVVLGVGAGWLRDRLRRARGDQAHHDHFLVRRNPAACRTRHLWVGYFSLPFRMINWMRTSSAATLAPLTERTIVDRDQLRGRSVERPAVRGWCVVDQELEHGVRSVAVPVHDARRPGRGGGEHQCSCRPECR